MFQTNPLVDFFELYISGTPEKSLVPEAKLKLCNLTNNTANVLGLDAGKTYALHVTTRALKHLYDKKPAEEFTCILQGLSDVARYPTHIFANKAGKRGGFCLVGSFNGSEYICAIEIIPAQSSTG